MDGTDKGRGDLRGAAGATSTDKTGITINATGGDKPHDIMPPFIVVNYIIKYK